MSRNKGVQRSLHLRSNSSSLLSFDGIIGRLRLLYLRRNSSPPTLLSSSSPSLKLILSSSSFLSILFLSLSSLA